METQQLMSIWLIVAHWFIAGYSNVSSWLDYDPVCTLLLHEPFHLLCAQAADKATNTADFTHGTRAVCNSTSWWWVHVLCSYNTCPNTIWTVRCFSSLPFVR